MMNEKLKHIAEQCMGIPTLEERGQDDLDFHEVSVHEVREALNIAYTAGVIQGFKDAKENA